jgi:hypothetical protein
VLIVRNNEHDSEHDVGDDKVASSDIARGGGTAWERQGKSHGCHSNGAGLPMGWE